MAAFLICGIVHTLVVVPFFGRWSFSLIAAFACFGVLTIISRLAAPVLQQERWPIVVNTTLNITLVAGSFDIGFRVDKLLGF